MIFLKYSISLIQICFPLVKHRKTWFSYGVQFLIDCCCCSVSKSCPTLCNPMDCSTPGISVQHQFPETEQTHVHWVGDAIQPSHPLSSPSPPAFSIFPSIRVFFSESSFRIRWPKCWSFSISPSSEYARFISFRMDWFDLLAVQGTLKSLLQHNLKASIFWHSAFLMVQLSHLYMTNRKNHSFDYMGLCQQSDVSAF